MAHTSSPRVTTEELCIIAVIVGAHSQCARRGEDKSRNFRKNDLQIISAGGLRTGVFVGAATITLRQSTIQFGCQRYCFECVKVA